MLHLGEQMVWGSTQDASYLVQTELHEECSNPVNGWKLECINDLNVHESKCWKLGISDCASELVAVSSSTDRREETEFGKLCHAYIKKLDSFCSITPVDF